MVIADSNFGPMLQKYLLKLFTMSFLLFVNDPFILNKSGSLCLCLWAGYPSSFAQQRS